MDGCKGEGRAGMSEIKRDPICALDANGDELATFDANHSLADIARWVCRNPSEGADVARIIGDILAGIDGKVMQ